MGSSFSIWFPKEISCSNAEFNFIMRQAILALPVNDINFQYQRILTNLKEYFKAHPNSEIAEIKSLDVQFNRLVELNNRKREDLQKLLKTTDERAICPRCGSTFDLLEIKKERFQNATCYYCPECMVTLCKVKGE